MTEEEREIAELKADKIALDILDIDGDESYFFSEVYND